MKKKIERDGSRGNLVNRRERALFVRESHWGRFRKIERVKSSGGSSDGRVLCDFEGKVLYNEKDVGALFARDPESLRGGSTAFIVSGDQNTKWISITWDMGVPVRSTRSSSSPPRRYFRRHAAITRGLN